MTDSTRTWSIFSTNILDERRCDILIEGGVIATIGDEACDGTKDARRADADGLIALPGLVDIRTRLHQPGQEDTEAIEAGIQAAAVGGYTVVHAMTNTTPVTDTTLTVDQVWEVGCECGWVGVHPAGAVTKSLKGEQLSAIGAVADPHTKARAFPDDGKCVSDPMLMRRILKYVKTLDGVVVQHSQDPLLTESAQMNGSPSSGELDLPGQPAVAKEAIITRGTPLAKHVGSHAHVCHLSTIGSVELIRRGKKMGVKATVEATPHYLLLTEELVRSYDLLHKANPFLRTTGGVEAVRQGLANGTIDIVDTGHAPHSLESKDCEWQAGVFGMAELKTALSTPIETMVNTGRIIWVDITCVLSITPAKIGCVPTQGQGSIVGTLASITLVDPPVRRIVDPVTQQSRSSNSPYRGMELPGQVLYAFHQGEPMVLAGEPIPKENR